MTTHHCSHLLFVSLLFLGANSAQAEQLLRWKFKEGETLKLELTHKSEIETTVANKPLKVNVEMFMGLDWQVESVDEQGTAQLAQSFTRLRLRLDVPRQDPIEYDSAAQVKSVGPAKEVADAVGSLLGAKFFVTMTSRGEITDVKISDEAAKLFESPAAARWKETLSKEGLTEMLRQSAAVLPEKPVDVDAQWTVPATSKSPLGPLKLAHKYTYLGSEERGGKMLEKIGVETSLELAETKGKTELKDHKHAGTLYFDAAAGRFAESQLTQQLTTEAPYRDTVVKAKTISTLQMKLTGLTP